MAGSTHDKLLPVARYGVCKGKKTPFGKGKDRRTDSMIFIHSIYNNIINSGARFLRLYQEESKMGYLYQGINVLGGRNQTQKLTKLRCTFLHQYLD